jgi:transcriptional regulator
VYLPEHFRESRPQILHRFVEQHPLATLIAHTTQGLTANHLPLLWHIADHEPAEDGSADQRMLRGHIARGNTLWREVGDGAQVLAVFTGAQHYISPTWYPSKGEHGRVVPTWNYAAVHVRGHIRFIDDAAWLRSLVGALTDTHEQRNTRRWHVSDAPPDYIEAMLRAIVGFEITVTGLEGKFKSSQNRSEADRDGVVAALGAGGVSASAISELVRAGET